MTGLPGIDVNEALQHGGRRLEENPDGATWQVLAYDGSVENDGVDGFPPYAWTTCTDWMNDYHANSQVIQLADAENGKPVVYRGSWTMTMQKVSGHWAMMGSGCAWTGY